MWFIVPDSHPAEGFLVHASWARASASCSVADGLPAVWRGLLLCTHSSGDGHVGCFYFWDIFTNSVALNFCVRAFVQTYIFLYPGYVTSGGIARSCGHFMCNCLGAGQPVHQSSCSVLCSHRALCKSKPRRMPMVKPVFNSTLIYIFTSNVLNIIFLKYIEGETMKQSELLRFICVPIIITFSPLDHKLLQAVHICSLK